MKFTSPDTCRTCAQLVWHPDGRVTPCGAHQIEFADTWHRLTHAPPASTVAVRKYVWLRVFTQRQRETVKRESIARGLVLDVVGTLKARNYHARR